MKDITLLQVNFSESEAEKDIRTIRNQVFGKEQKIPKHLEWDGRDNSACHIIAKHTLCGVVACGRLLPDAHIGRIAVLAEWRNKGIGSKLLSELCHLASTRNYPAVYLSAQQSAISFYQQNGFQVSGEIFIEAGINHCPMTKVV